MCLPLPFTSLNEVTMTFTRNQIYALIALAFGFGLVILVGFAAVLFLLGNDGTDTITVTVTPPDNIPDVVNLALADMQIRYNREISLADLDSYDWDVQRFVDSSLGCPQPNQTYNPVETDGYVIVLVYENMIHEYHIGVDGQPLVYCDVVGGVPAPTVDPLLPTPTATLMN